MRCGWRLKRPIVLRFERPTNIDMARNFRLNVIAEGVETEAQLAFLKQHGCMTYQGYLFSKTVPLEEFEALLGGL